MLAVQLLDPSAKVPIRASEGAAGYDLFALQDVVVPAILGQPVDKDDVQIAVHQTLVRTGISIALPPGTYAQLASRSGLAVKPNIHVAAGVIDPDYRGEVKVLLQSRLFHHGRRSHCTIARLADPNPYHYVGI